MSSRQSASVTTSRRPRASAWRFSGLDEHHYGGRTFLSLGSEKRPQEAAARLFAALRELDERGDTVALCEAVDTAGIGLAVMNRMGRAAAFDIEQV